MILKKRPAITDDKETIYRLSCAAYHDVVVAQFGPWDEAWQRANFEKKWDPNKYAVISGGDETIGVMAIEDHPDHIFLSEIQIDPPHQNCGVGIQILRELIVESRQRQLPIRLRVLKMNRARQFYERLGFVKTAETDTHFNMEWR